MIKTIKTIFTTLLLATLPMLTMAVDFDPANNDLTGVLNDKALKTLALGNTSPTIAAFNLVNTGLSLLAAICVGLLLYAGFLWIWARGSEDEIKKAKDIIRGTVVGLIIALAALGITRFVFLTAADITGATTDTTSIYINQGPLA